MIRPPKSNHPEFSIQNHPSKQSIVSQTRYLSLTGSEIAIIQNLLSGTEKSSIFDKKHQKPTKSTNFSPKSPLNLLSLIPLSFVSFLILQSLNLLMLLFAALFSQKRSLLKTKMKYFKNFYLLTLHRVTRIQHRKSRLFSAKNALRSNYRGSLFLPVLSLSKGPH
jgi:hypothetical protein